jgi:hypothetical protein
LHAANERGEHALSREIKMGCLQPHKNKLGDIPTHKKKKGDPFTP